jgi:molybdate/tungstate transport system substrate-binding protein
MRLKLLLLLGGLLFVLASCHRGSGNQKKAEIYILHAGSFSMPVKELVDSFEHLHPGVSILTEPCGSVDCARKITELGKSADIFISADYGVIEQMLIPDWATWQLPFVNNSMVIAFTPESRYAEEIDSLSWMNILLREDVIYGRSDPDADPCGYRSLMVLKLAEQAYNRKGLHDLFINKNTTYIRPKEVDLLGLLQSHALDYIFIYKSVAVQQGLRFVELPEQINLGAEHFRLSYAQTGIDIRGNKPGTMIRIQAEPIRYSLCIPLQAKNPELAMEFVIFMLTEGREILHKMGHELMLPPSPPDNLPASLKTKLF